MFIGAFHDPTEVTEGLMVVDTEDKVHHGDHPPKLLSLSVIWRERHINLFPIIFTMGDYEARWRDPS